MTNQERKDKIIETSIYVNGIRFMIDRKAKNRQSNQQAFENIDMLASEALKVLVELIDNETGE